MEVSPDIKPAMDAFRKDTSPINWILVGFPTPDDSSKLVLLGTGEGGIEALAGHCPDGDVAYGVVSRQYVMDEAVGMGKTVATKFIRVTWRPEAKLSMKRKMKMGTLDGEIKKVLGSSHADLDTDDKSQLTDEVIVKIIERMTQKVDNVASAEGKQVSSFFNSGNAVQARNASSDKAAAAKRHDAYMDPSNLTGQAKGAECDFDDLDAIKAALADVRNDTTPTTWALIGYKDKKTLHLIGKGEGDVSMLLEACIPATACFGLFRVTEQIDKTTAVKFCLLTWAPEDIPVMARASQSTHRGTILPVLRPYHVDFTVSNKNELNHSAVMDHIMSLSGTKSHVTDSKPVVKEEHYERKMLGGVKAEEVQPLEFVDKDALVAAVKAVRLDSDPTTWAVATYQIDGKNVKLMLKATGTTGIAEFAASLCADDANTSYGIYRTQQTIDRTIATKFVFVTFGGPNMAPMVKAKISTLRGAAIGLFQPFHAEFFIDRASELSEESVAKRLT